MRLRPNTLLVLLIASVVAAALAVVSSFASRGTQGHAGSDEQSAAQRIADAGITARIKTAFLLNPHLSSFGIDVDTDGGVVTLQGKVRSGIQKDLAGEIARHAEGVRAFRNELRVGGGPARDADEVDLTFSQAVIDATVSASVRTALDRDLDAGGIDVSTRWGTVTLKGHVATRAERDLAEKVAQDTAGVREVDNQLEVRG